MFLTSTLVLLDERVFLCMFNTALSLPGRPHPISLAFRMAGFC
jgi:hypothetical protein